MNQPSALSCVVPVLPATSPRTPKRVRMLPGAARDDVAHHVEQRLVGFAVERASGGAGAIRPARRPAGFDARHHLRLGVEPPFAIVAYDATISFSVTGLVPSASDGTRSSGFAHAHVARELRDGRRADLPSPAR
jgi:hypothetical protein